MSLRLWFYQFTGITRRSHAEQTDCEGRETQRGEKKESRNADTEEGVVWKETTRAEFVPDNCNGNLSLADKYGQTEVSLCVSVGRSLGGSGIQAELTGSS